MFSALVVLFRLVAGLVILAGTWFVFDTIHDRNTEIIVATIGLLYSFIFVISGRLQYFGLTVFSFFGRASSYVQKIPYKARGFPTAPRPQQWTPICLPTQIQAVEPICVWRAIAQRNP